MSSIFYHIALGLVGILIIGTVYSIFDQINMGNFYNFAIQMNLNGDFINFYAWMWGMITITITLAVVIGWWVQAHYARNEG